jgi:16S rRNA (guanine(527)-N(7))-methyltransferase GidB
MNKETFINEIKKLGISISENNYTDLEKYYELLIEYNKKINLTSITDKEEVFLKHFYDSLTLIKSIDLKTPQSLCDIGTGAGFPGLVLKIIFPNLKITLVDALDKRIKFLNLVIKELQLTNIETVHARSEEYSKTHIEEFDVVVSRAVSKTNILLEMTSQLVKINGLAIFMKANIDKELEESEKAIKKLGFKTNRIEKFYLPIENSIRNLLILEKISKTPKTYPREFSKIKKIHCKKQLSLV